MREDLKPLLSLVEKPGRYTGGEEGAVYKDKNKIRCRVAFCFPDLYEIGMSNLGMRILVGALNRADDVWCERVYAPWTDMEALMRERHIPLFTHESGDDVGTFDIVAFTLQYELCYTAALNMLDLAGIPLLARERGEDAPIVLAGGPCAYNAEPMADFVDVFSIGEGEESLPELARLYIKMKESGTYTREKFLREASHIEGFYVPSLYDVTYKDDGTVAAITPRYPDVPAKVKKRLIADMDNAYTPEKPVLPYIETVHDRVVLEVYRGCIRGCRFCQAGFVSRPVREKSPERLDELARTLVGNTGYDEISMCTLSISDYSRVNDMTDRLLSWTDDRKINISFPSLRADSFTKELMDKVSSVRSSTLTFAPEAGTQRMRDVINKNVTEEEILAACRVAFAAGKSQVKLYFMDGLPYETDEDVKAIAEVANHVVDAFYQTPGHSRKMPQVTISVACFIPKPHTPLQWVGQNDMAELQRKQALLLEAVRPYRKVKYNYHDADVSKLEAVFARGDRRLSKSLLEAHRRGIKWDAWETEFSYAAWASVFDDTGVDPNFYACRNIPDDEVLPWDMIDSGVEKRFLLAELHRAAEAATTPSCREKCSGCGANKLVSPDACRWCPGHPDYPSDEPLKPTAPAAEETAIPSPAAEKSTAPAPAAGNNDAAKTARRAVKIRFSKAGGMTYIGHLDLIRVVTRVILRSGIPVYYTEGFNPIPHIQFAPPLSVGCAGERELCEIRVLGDMSDEEVLARLRAAAPADMVIHEAFSSDTKLGLIKWADVELRVVGCRGSEKLAADAEALFRAPVTLLKKTKSGEKETDITPFVKSLTASYEPADDSLVIRAVTAAESGFYLNPSYIYKALTEKLGVPGYPTYCRKMLLDADGREFR